MLEWWQLAGLLVGGAVLSTGVFMLRAGRTRDVSEADRAEPGGLSVPTRLAVGLSLLVVGYHAAAYSLPTGWLWLRVPVDRLWVMGVALAAVVVGSLFLDGREGR